MSGENNTTTYRSVGFTTFGTANVSTAYNRSDSNGSNTSTAYNSTHGTQCAAATFGRTQGWAYNANKWVLNLYGSRSSGIEAGFDAQEVVPPDEPNNSELGTKDPTISSNSWGYRAVPSSSGYFFIKEQVEYLILMVVTGIHIAAVIPDLDSKGMLGGMEITMVVQG